MRCSGIINHPDSVPGCKRAGRKSGFAPYAPPTSIHQPGFVYRMTIHNQKYFPSGLPRQSHQAVKKIQKHPCRETLAKNHKGQPPPISDGRDRVAAKALTGAPSWAEFSRLQKQNRKLLELVGEITFKLSMTKKTVERRKKQISTCPSPWRIPREPVLRPANEGEGLAPQGPPGSKAADPFLLRLPATCYGTGTLPPAGAEGHASVWRQAPPQERQKMEKI